MTTIETLKSAKECSAAAPLDTEQKNRAIEYMAKEIEAAADSIIAENQKDMEDAKGKLSESMLAILTDNIAPYSRTAFIPS